MADEGFLRRWARRKSELQSEVREAPAREPAPGAAAQRAVAAGVVQPVPPDGALVAGGAGQLPPLEALPGLQRRAATEQPGAATARPLPTMDDVAALDKDSDFSAFVTRGVDQAVRRSALKKLFADPHFKVMDRLDVYIDDYTKPSPMSEAMLASLEHAKSVFMKMVEDEAPQPEQPQQPPEQETQ